MVMFSCGRVDPESSEVVEETTTTSLTTTSTTAARTTTTIKATTTTTTKETMTTTTEAVTTTEVVTEPVVYTPVEEYEEPVEEVIEEPVVEEPVMATDLPITEYERILLTNVVCSEYGSDYHGYGGPPVTLYERACVVAVVMNRVVDSGHPNTIEGVLTEPHQFSGYYVSNSYYGSVTQNCIDAVYYYFNHADEFPYYLSFWGDGAYNHFS